MHNHVSENFCDFSHDTNFDNIDASVTGIVCIMQTVPNKICPVIKVKFLHDNDQQKTWLTNDIKSLTKEKNKLHNKYLRKPLPCGH